MVAKYGRKARVWCHFLHFQDQGITSIILTDIIVKIVIFYAFNDHTFQTLRKAPGQLTQLVTI